MVSGTSILFRLHGANIQPVTKYRKVNAEIQDPINALWPLVPQAYWEGIEGRSSTYKLQAEMRL